jgi:hypothetical protein
LVDADGNVYNGQDAGRRYQRAGHIGGQPAALASHGDELYVALHTERGHAQVTAAGPGPSRVAP